MIKNALIFLTFNAKLNDCCDYVANTCQILAKHNKVFGFAMAETKSWKDLLKVAQNGQDLKKLFFVKQWNSQIFIPFQFVPGQRFTFIKQINYLLNWFILLIYFQVFYFELNKFIWFFELSNMNLLLTISKPFFVSVFDCVDYHAGDDQKLAIKLTKLIKKADYVFTVSNSLKRKLVKTSKRKNIKVVPLGFSLGQFKTCALLGNKKFNSSLKYKIGFIGAINNRIDYELLFKLATKLPKCEFIFVGPKQENQDLELKQKIKKLFSYNNVKYFGKVKKSKISKIINQFDIGLIPYNINGQFNKLCYPMKLMEYFYCGLPVISTNIKEVAKFEKWCLIVDKENCLQRIKTFFPNKVWTKERQIEEREFAISQSWKKKIDLVTKNIK